MEAWLKKVSKPAHVKFEMTDEQTGEPNGIVITGYTKYSNEWKAAEAKQSRGSKQSIIIEKGIQRIEISSEAATKRRKLYANMITGMTNDGKSAGDVENLRDQLIHNAAAADVLDKWMEYLDEGVAFLEKSAPVPKNTLAA